MDGVPQKRVVGKAQQGQTGLRCHHKRQLIQIDQIFATHLDKDLGRCLGVKPEEDLGPVRNRGEIASLKQILDIGFGRTSLGLVLLRRSSRSRSRRRGIGRRSSSSIDLLHSDLGVARRLRNLVLLVRILNEHISSGIGARLLNSAGTGLLLSSLELASKLVRLARNKRAQVLVRHCVSGLANRLELARVNVLGRIVELENILLGAKHVPCKNALRLVLAAESCNSEAIRKAKEDVGTFIERLRSKAHANRVVAVRLHLARRKDRNTKDLAGLVARGHNKCRALHILVKILVVEDSIVLQPGTAHHAVEHSRTIGIRTIVALTTHGTLNALRTHLSNNALDALNAIRTRRTRLVAAAARNTRESNLASRALGTKLSRLALVASRTNRTGNTRETLHATDATVAIGTLRTTHASRTRHAARAVGPRLALRTSETSVAARARLALGALGPSETRVALSTGRALRTADAAGAHKTTQTNNAFVALDTLLTNHTNHTHGTLLAADALDADLAALATHARIAAEAARTRRSLVTSHTCAERTSGAHGANLALVAVRTNNTGLVVELTRGTHGANRAFDSGITLGTLLTARTQRTRLAADAHFAFLALIAGRAFVALGAHRSNITTRALRTTRTSELVLARETFRTLRTLVTTGTKLAEVALRA
eukprot:comp21796_c0_seq3/m.48951 comp21796_c0_seq3/g.48951  ORF comp21796_c0_seq3/g.48951 comp21796_c0_seq3/m.48951 type:complete len:658 (+) comp21796_c0_seq3:193-2166(+)